MATIEQAQRKVDAIDKRIDAVRAEMFRIAGVEFEAFDVMTDEGCDAARSAAHAARRDMPGYDGIERSLFLRRGDATDVRDRLIAKQARADELRAAREYRKRFEAKHHACPECGHSHYAAVAA